MEPIPSDSWSNWSALSPDVVAEIAIRITNLEDFMVFRGVCAAWRAATKDSFPRVPLLMLREEDNSDEFQFYNLSQGKVSMKLSLPEAKGKRCVEARFGWLLTVSHSGEMALLNPFSRDQIKLPNFQIFMDDIKRNRLLNCFQGFFFYRDWFIEKAVLSANPSETSDFVLMVIHCSLGYLFYLRSGDTVWTPIESRLSSEYFRYRYEYYQNTFVDLNHYDGRFYAVNSFGHVWVWDGIKPPTWVWDGYIPLDLLRLSTLKSKHGLYVPIFRRLYFVKTSSCNGNAGGGGSDFLLITRDLDDCAYKPSECIRFGNNYRSIPWHFNIYRLNSMSFCWDEAINSALLFGGENMVRIRQGFLYLGDNNITNAVFVEDDCRITSLGGDAIFIGDNVTISIPSSEAKRSGIKGNCIYFTHNFWNDDPDVLDEVRENNMGIYDLEDGSIERFHDVNHFMGRPLWVSPSFSGVSWSWRETHRI